MRATAHLAAHRHFHRHLRLLGLQGIQIQKCPRRRNRRHRLHGTIDAARETSAQLVLAGRDGVASRLVTLSTVLATARLRTSPIWMGRTPPGMGGSVPGHYGMR